MARKRIGELLLERGVITQAQLEEGLVLQRQTRQRLGMVLLQKGFLQEAQLARALSEATGIPEVDLNALQPEWAAIHTLRPAFCEANGVFPIALQSDKEGKLLLVAMSDPLNASALEEISFTTGLKVLPRVAPLSAVRAAILRYYHRRTPGELEEHGLPLVQGRSVPAAPASAPAEEEVIEGEVVDEQQATRAELAQRIKELEAQERARRPVGKRPQAAGDDLSKDLDYLFGMADQPDPLEQLERKFWALMRLMAKKGLLTREEFTRELDEDPE